VKEATPHLVRLGPLDELHEVGLTHGNPDYPARKLGMRRIRGDISVFRFDTDIQTKPMRASACISGSTAWYFEATPTRYPAAKRYVGLFSSMVEN